MELRWHTSDPQAPMMHKGCNSTCGAWAAEALALGCCFYLYRPPSLTPQPASSSIPEHAEVVSPIHVSTSVTHGGAGHSACQKGTRTVGSTGRREGAWRLQCECRLPAGNPSSPTGYMVKGKVLVGTGPKWAHPLGPPDPAMPRHVAG